LTLRTFHTGGVASGRDITSGLPRVEELFEARPPRAAAVLAQIDGTVTVEHAAGGTRLRIVSGDEGGEQVSAVPATARLLVKDGDHVEAGAPLTDGAWDPHHLLAAAGAARTQRYLVDAVQEVYHAQGVAIHDKHIEVIVRQMLRAVRIAAPGDTALLPGELVDRAIFGAHNEPVLAQGGVPATASAVLLGVSRAAMVGDGFLAAAAFQETTRVLARAAVARASDHLHDLTANVLLGRRLPAGTGLDGSPDVRAWRLAVGDVSPAAEAGDAVVVTPSANQPDAGEDEIDAPALTALLAELQTAAEPALPG
jgi:DNA-directed RNA polymerase subunit beta'